VGYYPFLDWHTDIFSDTSIYKIEKGCFEGGQDSHFGIEQPGEAGGHVEQGVNYWPIWSIRCNGRF
jgi:hypothetical protein